MTNETDSDKPNEAIPEAPSPKAMIPAKLHIPNQMGLVAVQHRPLFPNMVVPLMVEGKVFLNSLQYSLKLNPPFLVVTLTKPSFNSQKIRGEDLHTVGVAARVARVFSQNSDGAQVLLDVVCRVQIDEVEVGEEIIAKVHPLLEEPVVVNDSLKAFSREILSAMKELVKLNPLVREELSQFINQINIEDPFRLADFAATLTSAEREDLQGILSELNIHARLEKTLLLIKKELDLSRLQSRISKQIEERISKNQRDFFLREQLKEIKKELGLSKDDKSQEVEKFQKRAQGLKWDKEVKAVFQDELEKLKVLEPQSAEYSVTRGYLEWLTNLPWGIYKKGSLDLKKAQAILEEDHYGLEDVKDRILDLIASMAMRKQVTGKIICLIGPPGVGKTSIGRSVARALNRPFYRFSLGGMRDEAEIKGHRRTYIGAMPGKFIQAMKSTKYSNPVIMLDEIDKLGRSYQGDPGSALLEVLDPEQNVGFLDHYLDVPFDLSKVLFICTANQIDTIPLPLQDRMEVIRLSGYIAEEKLKIAQKYLVQKQLKDNGLTEAQLSFEEKALQLVISGYAREAGVRSLEQQVNKICRRVARDYLEGKLQFPTRIGLAEVGKYLKRPTYEQEEIFGEGLPGCVNGLAWTANGGAVLNVEATLLPIGKRGFKQTGQLGKVMVESSDIAYSYVVANAQRFGIDQKKIAENSVHLHVPAGATPKDGPSAGITMAVALISIFLGRAVESKVGMTGELGLTGEILPIGGLREKVIAAKRVGLEQLLVPNQNRKDYEDLPPYLTEGLKFHFVSQMDEVLPICFHGWVEPKNLPLLPNKPKPTKPKVKALKIDVPMPMPSSHPSPKVRLRK